MALPPRIEERTDTIEPYEGRGNEPPVQFREEGYLLEKSLNEAEYQLDLLKFMEARAKNRRFLYTWMLGVAGAVLIATIVALISDLLRPGSLMPYARTLDFVSSLLGIATCALAGATAAWTSLEAGRAELALVDAEAKRLTRLMVEAQNALEDDQSFGVILREHVR